MSNHKSSLPKKSTHSLVAVEDHIMLFFGPPGVGKTTFVNNMGKRVLFLSTDRGTRFLDALRYECNSWLNFKKVIKELKEKGAPTYDIVAIDHISDWALMGEKYVLEKLGVDALSDPGYGKGWSTYKKLLSNYIMDLKSLDMGIVFITHEITKTVKISGLEVDKVMPDINKTTSNILIPLVDLVGYISMKPIKKGGKRTEVRVLETEPRRDLYAKDRTRRQRPTSGWEYLNGQKFVKTFR